VANEKTSLPSHKRKQKFMDVLTAADVTIIVEAV